MTVRNDNWGSRARVGMFIVGNEAVPEAEWWAMRPAGVSVHAARVTASAPWAGWRAGRKGVDLPDDLARGLRQFAAMRLSAVTIGHSSSSFLGGKGWDEAVAAALAGGLDDSVAVTTNGLDTLAALRASGVRRPYLVMPPWYNDKVVAAGLRYFEDHGLEPAGHLHYDPGPDWRDVPRGDLVGRGMGFEQEVEPLHAQIVAGCPPAADGIFIAGTGFRCVAILDALETERKIPVISANQASLWHCLQLADVSCDIPGYGKLLNL